LNSPYTLPPYKQRVSRILSAAVGGGLEQRGAQRAPGLPDWVAEGLRDAREANAAGEDDVVDAILDRLERKLGRSYDVPRLECPNCTLRFLFPGPLADHRRNAHGVEE
jgi:hypothetical protein